MEEVRFLHQQGDAAEKAAREALSSAERQGLQQLARHYYTEARRLNLADSVDRRMEAALYR